MRVAWKVIGGVFSLTTFLLSMSAQAQECLVYDTGVLPPGEIQIDSEGACHGTEEACLRRLIPRRPTLAVQTPGSFFVGWAYYEKTWNLIFGPQVGIGAAISFPIARPGLEMTKENVYELPREMSFTFDILVSLNANLSGLRLPMNQETPTATGTEQVAETQFAFAGAIFIGPQIGWTWYDNGDAKKVIIPIGIIGGFFTNQEIEVAPILGFQPALAVQF